MTTTTTTTRPTTPPILTTGRPAKRHEVKCWVQPFNDLLAGTKRADLRRCDDRNFRKGDELLEREYIAGSDIFTGRALICRITHITRFAGELPLGAIEIDEERGQRSLVPLACLSVEVLEVGLYEALSATQVNA